MRPGRHDDKRENAMREELRVIYRETDEMFANVTCDGSTECCRFGITGREPYPTAIEIDLVLRAIAATGKVVGRGRRHLALHGPSDRACPLLSAEGRCLVYASRPFGCRTFFCDRAEGKEPARAEVLAQSRRIADLSARFQPENPGPRPLTRVLDKP